jgi:malate synthase
VTTTAVRTTRLPESVGLPPGVAVRAPVDGAWADVLTRGTLAFIARLHREFERDRQTLLRRRVARQHELDRGVQPDFLPESQWIRDGDWRIAPIPADLLDRRVEITGPVDRKMIINALNSGANVFMADFEDATSPTWHNLLDGQANLRDHVRGMLRYVSPEGKQYELNERVATLMVRPRGLHLPERHVLVDGEPVAGALFDFGVFFYHNALPLLEQGTGPYFYLPKLESHLEARFWNSVFDFAQGELAIPRGSVRATVLIETVLAAFEMDEILYELREHSAGLNCGRWDYIFSFIKKFRSRPEFALPDRALVTMDRHFLKSYSELLVRTCHHRGAHAMGGMAAYIPVRDDPAANECALERVCQDKLREVQAGHDGTWVAHPGLVPVARGVFDAHMPTSHQIHVAREDVWVTASDLLAVPEGSATFGGLRTNLDVGLQYLEAWLRGSGCVPLYSLMEDTATAEISRTQVWQWLRHGIRLEDGPPVVGPLVREIMVEVLTGIERRVGSAAFHRSRFLTATRLLDELITAPECPEFLTTVAYAWLD